MSIDTLKTEIARTFGTPAVVVDLDKVERNIARIQAICDKAGIANRPHIKTHKSPVLAQLQVAPHLMVKVCSTKMVTHIYWLQLTQRSLVTTRHMASRLVTLFVMACAACMAKIQKTFITT